jgi:hypothetical protein
MSLDFSLEITSPHEIYSGNYTHNVSDMWRLSGVYDALYNSEGKKAKEITSILLKSYSKMLAKPAQYKKLNPKNGWGDYGTALKFLLEILQQCQEFPEAIIRISK